MTWVVQAQHGSDEAFTKLVEAYQTHVYNLCYRMLGDAKSAEDTAQETFLRAYQHLHRYNSKRPLQPGCYPLPHIIASTAYVVANSPWSRWMPREDETSLELPDADAPQSRIWK